MKTNLLCGLLLVALMACVNLNLACADDSLSSANTPFVYIEKEVRDSWPLKEWSLNSRSMEFGMVGKEEPGSFLTELCKANGFENSKKSLRRLPSGPWLIPVPANTVLIPTDKGPVAFETFVSVPVAAPAPVAQTTAPTAEMEKLAQENDTLSKENISLMKRMNEKDTLIQTKDKDLEALRKENSKLQAQVAAQVSETPGMRSWILKAIGFLYDIRWFIAFLLIFAILVALGVFVLIRKRNREEKRKKDFRPSPSPAPEYSNKYEEETPDVPDPDKESPEIIPIPAPTHKDLVAQEEPPVAELELGSEVEEIKTSPSALPQEEDSDLKALALQLTELDPEDPNPNIPEFVPIEASQLSEEFKEKFYRAYGNIPMGKAVILPRQDMVPIDNPGANCAELVMIGAGEVNPRTRRYNAYHLACNPHQVILFENIKGHFKVCEICREEKHRVALKKDPQPQNGKELVKAGVE